MPTPYGVHLLSFNYLSLKKKKGTAVDEGADSIFVGGAGDQSPVKSVLTGGITDPSHHQHDIGMICPFGSSCLRENFANICLSRSGYS